jgi:hypothetical protein
MKKLVATLIVVLLTLILLLPTAVYARGDKGDRHDGDGDVERYALVIGISDYPGHLNVLKGGLDLFYADDDARTTREVLKHTYGIEPQNITVLEDRKATYSGILAEIAKLNEKVDEDDEVLFTFSGHAVVPDIEPFRQFFDPSGSYPEETVGLLVWADDLNNNYPWLLMDVDLEDAFADFNTDNIVFVFDNCFAERFDELADEGRVLIGATEVNGISGEYGPHYASVGAVKLQDIGWMRQGLFSYFFFVQGLSWGLGDALAGNTDGVTTVQEAFYFAQAVLMLWSGNSGGMLTEYPVMIDNTGGAVDFY